MIKSQDVFGVLCVYGRHQGVKKDSEEGKWNIGFLSLNKMLRRSSMILSRQCFCVLHHYHDWFCVLIQPESVKFQGQKFGQQKSANGKRQGCLKGGALALEGHDLRGCSCCFIRIVILRELCYDPVTNGPSWSLACVSSSHLSCSCTFYHLFAVIQPVSVSALSLDFKYYNLSKFFKNSIQNLRYFNKAIEIVSPHKVIQK